MSKLHPGITEADYIALPGVRVSTLKRCLDNPHAAKDPWPTSDAMLLGSLVHCMVLEPGKVEDLYIVEENTLTAAVRSHDEYLDLLYNGDEMSDAVAEVGALVNCMVEHPDSFDSRYAVYPGRHDARAKAYQDFCEYNKGKAILKQKTFEKASEIADAVELHDDFLARICGKTIVKQSTYDQALDMAAAVAAHPAIAYIENANNIECGITFDVNGLLVKGKADVIVYDEDGTPCILDVKTTRDASRRNFARDCARMHYGMQLAAYGYGVAQAIGVDHTDYRYLVLAVENSGTPRVACWELDAESVVFGLEQLMDAAMIYNEMERAGWPVNYNDDFERITLQKW